MVDKPPSPSLECDWSGQHPELFYSARMPYSGLDTAVLRDGGLGRRMTLVWPSAHWHALMKLERVRTPSSRLITAYSSSNSSPTRAILFVIKRTLMNSL